MNPNLSLHNKNLKDLSGLKKLYEDSYKIRIRQKTMPIQLAAHYDVVRDMAKLKQEIKQSDVTIWVAKKGKQSLGYMAFRENADDIRILQFHTIPDAEKPGSFLMDNLFERAKTSGAKTISVIPSFWSIKNYKNWGFEADRSGYLYQKDLTL